MDNYENVNPHTPQNHWVKEKLLDPTYSEETKETEIKPVRYVAICDCGGEYEYTGAVLLSNPPLYVHECCRCHLRTNLKSISPEIRYERNGVEVKCQENDLLNF